MYSHLPYQQHRRHGDHSFRNRSIYRILCSIPYRDHEFDLKTPGREDDDLDEENITLANDDFTAMAAVILEGLGGSANVKSIDNCITRLRLEINDDNKIDEAKIKSSGAAGIIRPGKGNIQVIIGPKVQFVADEMKNYVNKPLLLFIVFSENGPAICRLVLR